MKIFIKKDVFDHASFTFIFVKYAITRNLSVKSVQPFLVCLGIAFFISFPMSSQISVDFTSDISSGCSPITVAFNNLSLPVDGSSYQWDFGNGNFSTAKNPQTSYIEPGIYSVKLTVTNNGISETMVKENFISVHPNPIAEFKLLSDTIGCSPSEFVFQNLSSDPIGAAIKYTWSFGDGAKSTEQNPSHIYTSRGVFDVTLLAENQYGCLDSYSESQLVHVFKPIAQFGVDQTNSCNGELVAVFNNITDGEVPLNSQWDFGDGSSSGLFSPTHHYIEEGIFSVKLKVQDIYGCADEITRQDLIKIVKTQASFTVSRDTLCPSENLVLTNNSQYASNYLWKLGDKTTSTSINVTKKYIQPGDYSVWLIASQGNCIDSVSKNINIEYVKADFAPDEPFVCELPSTIQYQDQSYNAVKWNWSFGAGNVSSDKDPIVTYGSSIKLINNQASFADTLLVISKHGCTDRLIKENSVRIHIPDVKFSPGSGGDSKGLNICVPADMMVADKSIYNTSFDNIIDKQWRFNGQLIGNGDQAQFAVNQTGRIPIELTVTTAKGCVQKKTEYINSGQKVAPDFYRDGDYNVCASKAVNYIITSPEASYITNQVWDFGDDEEDNMMMPPHDYIKTGEMNVSLTVYNYGCASKVTKNNIVNIDGPIVTYKAVVDCTKPFERILQANIENATSYKWIFSDNNSIVENQSTIAHTFPGKGQFKVALSAQNSNNGCSYDFSRILYMTDISSNFQISSGTPCLNNTLTLDGSSSIDAIDYYNQDKYGKYLWYIKEENKTYFDTEPISHKFINKGINNVSLIVRDINGCVDTLNQEIMIYKPEPDFGANYKVGCMPVTFEFNDLSKSESPISTWLWNFGDNTTSTDQNPLHDYLDYGSYNVALKVTDQIGCSASITKGQVVQAVFPDASFAAADNTLCPGDSSRFFDTSSSNIVNYSWDISDGQSSSLQNPYFKFDTPGYYSASLKITDNHGCETTKLIEKYIHVQPFPKADFDADITNSNCYPLIVQFRDQSENLFPGNWQWHFGENNNLSELKNPFFIYNKPGHHDVRLIAKTSYGCADTIMKRQFIHVGGPYATLGMRDTVCRNADVVFVAEDQQNVYDTRWDFGDGYFGSGNNAKHQYKNAGVVFPVLFIRSDEDNTCNKAIVDTISVLDLQAKFAMEDALSKGCVPFIPMLSNQSLNSTGWIWDFGNGSFSGERSPDFKYTTPGSFDMRLIALHSLGCSDTTDWVPITVFPLPDITTNRDTNICVGSKAILYARGGIKYVWTPGGTLSDPTQAATSATPPLSTLYQVEVTDKNGCVSFGDVFVGVQQIPVVALRDTSLVIGEYLNVDITNPEIASYVWSESGSISCSDCPNPIIRPMDSESFQVSVTDTSNCFTISYPFNISIMKKYSIDVPKAFTPNGDGINDRIFVKGWGIKDLVYFKIFNRLGQEVYNSSILEEGWDGEFRGSAQPNETYNFNVKVKTYEGEVLTKSGVFKLLR